MVEYDRAKQRDLSDKTPLRICVAGIGGAGSNVLDRIALDRMVDADLVCLHTDVRELTRGMAPAKVQLGGELMRGVGAGGDPDLGREAALFSREAVRQSIQGHEMVFICTGLGGGTGSGAAPVVAEIAKSTGALVMVVATMPFSFEGRRRVNQAEEALELLQKRADALILFENNRMGELVLPKDGIQKAFGLADQLIGQSVRAVSSMISTPGLVKLGLDDLVAALHASNGRCLFGFGEAKGQNRGTEALKRALKSPLIDQGRLLHQTKNLLVHIVGGETLTLMETEALMKQLGRHVPDHTHILFGLAVDPKLGDSLSVTLISSLGLEELQQYQAQVETAAVIPSRQPVEEAPAAPEPEPPVMPVARAIAPAPPVQEVAPAPPPPPAAPTPFAQTQEVVKSEAVEEDAFDLFRATSAPAKKVRPSMVPVQEPEPVQPRRQPEPAPEPEPAPLPQAQMEDEFEEEVIEDQIEVSAPVLPPVEETASVPVRAEAPVVREEVKARPSPLSALVATAVPLAPAAPEDPAHEDAPPAASHRHAATAAVARKAADSSEQPSLRLGSNEDRGRFKDTEPSLVQGEDLDVPTWMRIKKKARN